LASRTMKQGADLRENPALATRKRRQFGRLLDGPGRREAAGLSGNVRLRHARNGGWRLLSAKSRYLRHLPIPFSPSSSVCGDRLVATLYTAPLRSDHLDGSHHHSGDGTGARRCNSSGLGDVGGDAPGLVAGEQLGRGAASRFLLEIGEHLPLVSTSMKHSGCYGSLQTTASPSIRHERTGSTVRAATICGKRCEKL